MYAIFICLTIVSFFRCHPKYWRAPRSRLCPEFQALISCPGFRLFCIFPHRGTKRRPGDRPQDDIWSWRHGIGSVWRACVVGIGYMGLRQADKRGRASRPTGATREASLCFHKLQLLLLRISNQYIPTMAAPLIGYNSGKTH